MNEEYEELLIEYRLYLLLKKIFGGIRGYMSFRRQKGRFTLKVYANGYEKVALQQQLIGVTGVGENKPHHTSHRGSCRTDLQWRTAVERAIGKETHHHVTSSRGISTWQLWKMKENLLKKQENVSRMKKMSYLRRVNKRND